VDLSSLSSLRLKRQEIKAEIDLLLSKKIQDSLSLVRLQREEKKLKKVIQSLENSVLPDVIA